MRHSVSMLLLMIFVIISGCSNINPSNGESNLESEYSRLIVQAKELDKQGKSEEAVEVLAKVVIKDEDMDFFTGLLDKTNKVSAPPLIITDKSSKRDGDYMITNGSIKNNSKTEYNNIKVKVIYTDANNNVIDTDWTYAVDSVGIKPNETKRFELMTKYVDGMENYRFEIIQ